MKAVKDIREELDHIVRSGGARRSALTFLFSNIRIVLEYKGEKGKYPYLSLVCNWYQHSEINRSAKALDVIEAVGDIILSEMSRPNAEDAERNEQLIHAISHAFGMNRLRAEMEGFFSEHDLNAVILQEQNWNEVLKGILYDLSERPLRLRPPGKKRKAGKLSAYDRKAARIRDRMEQKARRSRPDHWEWITPESFEIELDQGRFYWKVVMREVIVVKGPIVSA